MAASGGERRMVFDIRGRRKHVVKVVYAILALLMGASLFLVVGPVNIGSLFGGTTSSGNASGLYEEQAERIERKLKKDPQNPELLLGLTKTRINAGNALAAVNETTGEAEVTAAGAAQLEKASAAWSEYLKAAKSPSAAAAQLVAPALFSLAQAASSGNEAEANVKAAAEAQQIVADARPSLGSLSTLAIFRTFAFEYEAAKKIIKEAEKFAHTKFERENLGNQLEEITKRAHEFQKELKEYNKATKGKGKESLENPFGGLGSSGSLSEP
jgi:tetratricopeptide (TPR) repeat protein